MRYIKILPIFFLYGCNLKEIESPFLQSLWNAMSVFFSVVWENALSISIALVFISAFIGFICKARAVDKCMKSFAKDKVTVQNKTQKNIHGTFTLHSTGIELLFDKPSGEGVLRYSHILYKSEFPSIFWIARHQDNLSPASKAKREKQIKITCNPGYYRKFSRYFRNLLGSFRDAFTQTISMLIGQMQKKSPSSLILNQEKQISNIGADIIGYMGNNYDPILENYIGRKVVVEIIREDQIEEICGIFKEYSTEFLLLLNVPLLQNFTYEIAYKKIQKQREEIPLELQIARGKELEITNLSCSGIFLKHLQAESEIRSLEKFLEPGQKMALELPGFLLKSKDNTDALFHTFSIAVIRQSDLLLPRSHSIIRYSADTQKEDWKSIIKVDLDFFMIQKSR